MAPGRVVLDVFPPRLTSPDGSLRQKPTLSNAYSPLIDGPREGGSGNVAGSRTVRPRSSFLSTLDQHFQLFLKTISPNTGPLGRINFDTLDNTSLTLLPSVRLFARLTSHPIDRSVCLTFNFKLPRDHRESFKKLVLNGALSKQFAAFFISYDLLSQTS
ncbi:unnamed protein product [Protopolystoma xenopodis]|uniref:Uncharacterized protein n=1 Tax=Protopolystoma xenopodis TaxID=117903 RepID=A0A3S5B1C2_9PLAT|nr:unnamed protein product [Protopolystoma xenopodis]